MPDSRVYRLLRRLAGWLIRGREAAFILADIDGAMERELDGGITLWRARCRYAMNVLGSALSISRGRWRLDPMEVRRRTKGARNGPRRWSLQRTIRSV